MRTLLRLVLKLLFGVVIIGRERLDISRPTIIMPNHVSFLDALLLYVYLPDSVCYVVNRRIAGHIAFLLRWVEHIIIDPLNPYSLKLIIGVIKQGRTVVLFPEGRITNTGSLMKVYNGIGLIALRTDAAICPVAFYGPERSRYARARDKFRAVWFPKVLIYVGQPLRLELPEAGNFRRQKKRISDQILTLLQQTLFAARQAAERCRNLFDKLREAGAIHGFGKLMAEDINGELSYRQALIGSYALGGKLETLLGPDARPALLLPNSNGHLVTLFALAYLGKTTAILNFTAGAESCQDCCETGGVTHVLTSRIFLEKAGLEVLARRLEKSFPVLYLEDVKATIKIRDKMAALLCHWRKVKAAGSCDLILFTSGSESKPKGVVLHHSNLLANLNQIACVVDFNCRDRLLNALPMFHSFGLTGGTLLPVLSGIRVFLYPSPLHYTLIPEIAYDCDITILLGTPTFLQGYGRCAHPYDFHSLRYVLAGGEKLQDETRFLWHDKFGIRIFEGYGTTETGPVLSFNTPLFNKSGSVGRFLPGIAWRLEPVEGIEKGGELSVKGPNVMAGYLLHGKGFVPAEEWYESGDVVEMDEDQFISIKSRLKRFAKVSGEMISLDAVEKSAAQCFKTEGNAAVNLPDQRKGEKIILYTVCKDARKQELRQWMQEAGQTMLALPARVIIIEQLPLLGSGKTDYVRLKNQAATEFQDDAPDF